MQSRRIGFRTLLVTAAVWGTSSVADVPVTPLIEELTAELNEVHQILTQLAEAPAEGWIFTSTRDDYEERLDKILDDLLNVALGQEYTDSRDRVLDIDATLADLSAQRSSLIASRIEAPVESDPSLMDRALLREVPSGSQAAIDQEILSVDDEIERLEGEKRLIVTRFAERLRDDFNVDVTEDVATALLYQLNGEAIVEAAALFQVVRAIEARIAEIRGSVDDPEVLRRYYGVAALTRLLIVRLYERHIEDYDVLWLPRLAEIEADTMGLIEETTTQIGAASSATIQQAYQRNLDVQQSIVGVIIDYRAMLVDRRRQTDDGLAIAREDAALALNTLRTLETAAMLSEQMVWSESEFAALMSINAPELIPLDQEEVTRQFLDVSRLLAGS